MKNRKPPEGGFQSGGAEGDRIPVLNTRHISQLHD